MYARARELCAQIRDPALAFRALSGQWLMRWWKRDLHSALELADELMAAAGETKDPAMLLAATPRAALHFLPLGDFASANEHLEKALAVFDLQQPLRAELEARRLIRSPACTMACTTLAILIVLGRHHAR